MQTKDDLINECDFIKLCRRDNKIVAVSCYAQKKHPNKDNIYTNDRDSNPGRKAIAAAALDGYSGELLKIFKEDFSDKKRNVWGEYSKKAAVLAFKDGGLPVPVDIAEKIMVPKQFVDKKRTNISILVKSMVLNTLKLSLEIIYSTNMPLIRK